MFGLNFQNQVNAVGGIAILILGGYFAFEASKSRDAKPCSSRFRASTLMSLNAANGQPLAAAELQARAGFTERGMIEKASVRQGANAPSKHVLDVRVGGPASNDTGIGFAWSPSQFGAAETACLVYDVYVPADFDYASGGVLPGLQGQLLATIPGGTPGGQTGFSARMTWDNAGTLGVETVTADGAPNGHDLSEGRHKTAGSAVQRGRWTQIEQEVVLNADKAHDGVLRVWVDGRLTLEKTAMTWRTEPNLRLSGMLGDVGYSAVETAAPKKATVISVSQPKLSWQ